MRPITFTKVLAFPCKVAALEDIYIEDDIRYEMQFTDLHALGTIRITGRADTELESKEFAEKVDVDCLLSLARIDCQQDLRLQFKDYSVYLDERIVRFVLRYELLGNGEKVISFKEIASEEVEDKVLKALNRSFDDEGEDQARTNSAAIKELLQSGDLDIIGAEELLPLLAEEASPLDPEEIKTPEPLGDPNAEEELVAPLNFSSEMKEATIQKKPLFDDEVYSVAFFFIKVDDEDSTYESLAARFKLDPELLRKANLDKPLYRGKLVKIPR